MTVIVLETLIKADMERCFDLSRDVGTHLVSTKQTHERIVAGRNSGLFELGDEVTWEAIHLGIRQKLSSKITKFDAPVFFEDTMQKGVFRSMRHEHHFKKTEEGTLMTDMFEYEVPFGPGGRLFDVFYLKRYMKKLLTIRNEVIRALAEQK
jgi:ligand-binding SRPBCC domain-containing protein